MEEFQELHTWNKYTRDDERLKDVDWNLLCRHVQLIDSFQSRFPVEDKIEEPPPTVIGDTFCPGGWVGTYRLRDKLVRVVPDPKKLPSKEFTAMKEELGGWLQYIGPFLEDIFRQFTDEPLFKQLLFVAYSRNLIDCTEILLSHFIPRDVIPIEYVGTELRGRPLWKKTLIQRARNSPLLVSKRTKFSFRTLQNMLLARFHAELFRQMMDLTGSMSEDEIEFLEEWKTQTDYHRDFITTEMWSNLLEQSFAIDFSSSEVMEKTRRTGKGEVAEILDLWEAYVSNKTFLTDFGKRFDTALKPLSKIYELWCFKKICDILGIDHKKIRKFPCTHSFTTHGQKNKLFYNKGLRKHSKFISKFGKELGRPDFAIGNGGKIVCIIDAKCKPTENIDIGDKQRLLSYILDYIYPGMEKLTAIIFDISKSKEIKTVKARDCNVHIVPMTPSSFPHFEGKIRGLIENSITHGLVTKVCS